VFVEGGGFVNGDDDDLAGEAVLAGVEESELLAFLGLGTGGKLGILLVGCDLCLGCHVWVYLFALKVQDRNEGSGEIEL
jgi:hypothetical protein